MKTVRIHTEYIKLQQALKLAGLVESGGEVRALLAEGKVTLNGAPVAERGKKVRPGDVVGFNGESFTIEEEP